MTENSKQNVYYEILKTKDLKPLQIRDLREKTLQEIEENIQENGYYKARVLTVVRNENGDEVADGNHRLNVLLNMGIEEVPCAIYENVDPYQLAIKGNIAENTFAPMDLFDWLSIIQKLKEEGISGKEISKKINNNISWVKNYSALLNNISFAILKSAKQYQIGRETKKVSQETFNFTEYWFRTSGLYNLNPFYQLDCLRNFINSKFNWSKEKLQKETSKYKKWQEFVEIGKANLHDTHNILSLIKLIHNNTFKTNEQLLGKIDDFNSKARNKLICGDSTIELETIEDSSIDIIIFDSPYGQNYISQRSIYNDHISKEGVLNDDPEEAFSLLNKVCEILNRKTKSNAHFYIFCSWKTYPEFKTIIKQYFEIKNLIIWDKMNHGAGDLEYNWGDRYEMIIYAMKGKKPLQNRKQNIIQVSRISPEKLIHPTQKPVELIKELLEASAQYSDTVCDPFIGSGSTIKAIIQSNLELNYIGIEIDKEIFEKAKAFIGV